MRITFDDGTLLLEDAPDAVPYAEWDDRVDEYRAPERIMRPRECPGDRPTVRRWRVRTCAKFAGCVCD